MARHDTPRTRFAREMLARYEISLQRTCAFYARRWDECQVALNALGADAPSFVREWQREALDEYESARDRLATLRAVAS